MIAHGTNPIPAGKPAKAEKVERRARAGFALVVSGCQLADVTSDAEADAEAIAAAVASPSDGMTQEAMDVGGYFFGSPGRSGSLMNRQSHVFPVNHVRFFSGDLGSFLWNPAAEADLVFTDIDTAAGTVTIDGTRYRYRLSDGSRVD